MKKYFFALSGLASLILVSADSLHAQSVLPKCVKIPTTIKLGSKDTKSTYVADLQAFLLGKGYLKDAPTGYFGNKTLQAVKEFQKANKIDSTGAVGPITRAKIEQSIGACTTGGVVSIKTGTTTATSTASTTQVIATSTASSTGIISTSTSSEPIKTIAPDLTWNKVEAKLITKSSAHLEAEFTSTKAYTTYVKWGTGGTYNRRTGGIGASGTAQKVGYDISGLLPNTTYNFQFFVEDSSATQKPSVTGTFTTLSESTPTEVVVKIVAPKIESLSTNQIEPNMSFIINGSGFTPKGNTLYVASDDLKTSKIGDFDSLDGKKIQLVLPWSVSWGCENSTTACTPGTARLLPGYFYNLYIINSNGKSTAVTIKVIGNQ